MSRLRWVLAISLFLLIIPIAIASHKATLTITYQDPDPLYETQNVTFKFMIKNEGNSYEAIDNFTVTLPNFTIYGVNKNLWKGRINGSSVTWTRNGANKIDPDTAVFNFVIEATAIEIDADINSTWIVETRDSDSHNNLTTAGPVKIKNDAIAPDVINISPANFTYVKNEKIDFIINILEQETGVQSDAFIGFRDSSSVMFNGDVTENKSITCTNTQCDGSITPGNDYNFYPAAPFLDIRIINLKDYAGNIYDVVDLFTHHYYIDYQLPQVDLQSPTEGAQVQLDFYDFIFNMSDDSFITDLPGKNWKGDSPAINCTLYINGGNYGSNSSTQKVTNTTITADLSELGDNTHYWFVNCTDDAGWIGTSETRSFIRDVNAPDITLEAPTDNQFIQDNYTFIWTVTDAFDTTPTCNLTIDNTVKAENIEDTTYAVSGLAEESHNWSVTCTDDYSNSNSSETWDFTVDITPPIVDTIGKSPIDNSNDTDGNVRFYFNLTDNMDNTLDCELYLNDNLEWSGTKDVGNRYIARALDDNDYYWYIKCIDDALNEGVSPLKRVIVDTYLAPPAFSPDSPILTDQATILINFTAIFLEEVTIDSATFNESAVTLTTTDNKTFIYTATVPSDATYNFSVAATDLYGNSNSGYMPFIITYTPPPPPPPEDVPSGGGVIRDSYSGYEDELPPSYGDCGYTWTCDDWSECIDGAQTRTCTNMGECEGDKDKPPEARECTVPIEEETTGNLGIGFAADLFSRIKENWWVLPIIAGLLGVLGYFSFGKNSTKRKLYRKLKDKEPIDV